MSDNISANTLLSRLRLAALGVGGLAAVASLVGYLGDRQQFFQSYLIGYIYWLTVALGAAGLMMINYVAGGRWGYVIRRLNEAAALLIFLMAVLALPLLSGLPDLYKWARPGFGSDDPALKNVAIFHQASYFYLRLVVYFGIWCAVPLLLRFWSIQRETTRDPQPAPNAVVLSAPALFAYVLTITFAGLDFLCSLEPGWNSSIIGFYFGIDCLLSSMAFVIIMGVLLSKASPMREALVPDRLHDLGNLLLAFVMFWAYVSVSQFIIVWMANLPDEAHWYVRRTEHGWEWMARSLWVLHFGVPFFFLLFRNVKRSPSALACVAMGVLAVRWIDLVWQIAPVFRAEMRIHWLDVAVPIAMGGFFLAGFASVLQRQPLLARPEVPQANTHETSPVSEAA